MIPVSKAKANISSLLQLGYFYLWTRIIVQIIELLL